jgi:hypothetical protein
LAWATAGAREWTGAFAFFFTGLCVVTGFSATGGGAGSAAATTGSVGASGAVSGFLA